MTAAAYSLSKSDQYLKKKNKKKNTKWFFNLFRVEMRHQVQLFYGNRRQVIVTTLNIY